MTKQSSDMVRSTLDMLILKVVALEPMHGWGISERIQQVSADALLVNKGSLYASLHRLAREGWIRSEWRRTENNRRALLHPDPGGPEPARAGARSVGPAVRGGAGL
ncbi:MAG: helix-turn-helix transcriptional regulator [bacterium]